MSSLSNLLLPAVLFFVLGILTKVIKSDLRFPPDMAKMLSIYLLMSIGLHGGYVLAKADLVIALNSVLWALVMGFVIPIVGYLILLVTKRVGLLDAAAISAHYGSVSAGTFLTAIAYLDNAGLEYEQYPVIMLAVMETPAIIVGLILAAKARQTIAAREGSTRVISEEDAEDDKSNMRHLLHDAFTNGSVVVLLGSMLIGAIALPSGMEKLEPFTEEIFMGVLCLFLFEMGSVAGQRLGDLKQVGAVLALFGIVMPVIGGCIGVLVGSYLLDFGVGGTTLVAILAASASYIAVPPAMRLAVPEANPSFYLTLSLGITFPFNVIVGIPLFQSIADKLVA